MNKNFNLNFFSEFVDCYYCFFDYNRRKPWSCIKGLPSYIRKWSPFCNLYRLKIANCNSFYLVINVRPISHSIRCFLCSNQHIIFERFLFILLFCLLKMHANCELGRNQAQCQQALEMLNCYSIKWKHWSRGFVGGLVIIQKTCPAAAAESCC